MTNIKTTIGGALSALGTTLMGVGMIPQLAGTPSKFLTYCAVTGFILTALGQFFGSLFSADSATVKKLSDHISAGTKP